MRQFLISSDGRFAQDSRQNCVMNEAILAGAGKNNSRVYREFLQNQSNQLIRRQREQARVNHRLTCNCSKCKY